MAERHLSPEFHADEERTNAAATALVRALTCRILKRTQHMDTKSVNRSMLRQYLVAGQNKSV
jgi:hypothetical protein